MFDQLWLKSSSLFDGLSRNILWLRCRAIFFYWITEKNSWKHARAVKYYSEWKVIFNENLNFILFLISFIKLIKMHVLTDADDDDSSD